MSDSMTALATLEDGGQLTRTGLRVPSNISLERYEALGRLLMEAEDTLAWAQGEYLIAGEELFPEEHAQIWSNLGITATTAMQRMRVYQAIPAAERRLELSWSHHRAVYTMEKEERDRWLNDAVLRNWSKDELVSAIQDARQASNALPRPSRSYVLERVCDAAERAWEAAQKEGDHYRVPGLEFESLAAALGVELG